MDYRREIDGLRALAVIPVILFHAGFETFRGGFVGVDVFLVISGYLITTILWTESENGRFSLSGFYERRARRILPALFLVMAVCVPFAWFWLLPDDLKDFSQSLIAVPLFASNILFWRESGYFDGAAELKPLLHTWSLAVEEQYYLLFPLFFALMWNRWRCWIPALLSLILILSLCLAEWAAHVKPAAAFYLLPTRGWEILAGALLACYLAGEKATAHTTRWANSGGFTGLFLILYAVFAFDKQTPFPGFHAVVPIIGTILILTFATARTYIGKILGSRPLVGLGLVSYSAYLWHQPIFSLLRYTHAEEPSPLYMTGAIGLSLGLSYLSWRFVETPFRDNNRISRRAIVGFGVFLAMGFILLGLTINFNLGGAQHLFRTDMYAGQERSSLHDKNQFLIPSKSAPVILWGDSYADALASILGHALNQRGLPMIGFVKSSCPSLLHVKRNEDKRLGAGFAAECHNHNESVLSELREMKRQDHPPRYIVLTSAYGWYLSGLNGDGEPILQDEDDANLPPANHIPVNLKKTADLLIRMGLTPVIILPHPTFGDFGTLLRSGTLDDTRDVSTSTISARRDSHLLMSAFSSGKVIWIDATDILCGKGKDACPVFIKDADMPYIWRDGSHLSKSGASLIVDRILKVVHGG